MPKVLIAVFILLVSTGIARAENRVALVVGISGYNLLPPLASPKNNARLMAATLESVGFDVTTAIDVDVRGLRGAVDRFIRSLRNAGKGSVGLFYYSGHGARTGKDNYLIPLAAEIVTSADLHFEALAVSRIVSQMQDSGSKQSIIILDANRDNRFDRDSRSVARGLARMTDRTGSLIMLAASPGQVASDGSGHGSPFTSALAAAIREPGLSVQQVFRKVQTEVSSRTNGHQRPWLASSLDSGFYFAPASGTTTATTATTAAVAIAALEPPATDSSNDQRQQDIRFWNTVKDSGNSAMLRAYVYHFPDGRFSAAARIRLDQLQSARASPDTGGMTPRSDPADKADTAATAGKPSAPAPHSPETTLPAFPWPPPEPSVQMRLPRHPFAGAADLNAVSTRLVAALRKAGYWEYSFHRAPDGFALVTRLERINEDGSQVTEDVRYRLPGDEESFSLADYIKRLFFAAPGYYRLIVFVVTDRPFTATGDPIREKEALKLLRGGANVLPSEYSRMEFSTAYGVDALIYEFRKGSGDKQVNIVLPGRLSPQVHLRNAGLSVAFGLQQN